jgi:hypothetical protein
MAALKFSLLTFALIFCVPLANAPADMFSPTLPQTLLGVDAPHGGTVIYKTEAGFPEFMTKKSLPTRRYPTKFLPHPTASNQTIASL